MGRSTRLLAIVALQVALKAINTLTYADQYPSIA